MLDALREDFGRYPGPWHRRIRLSLSHPSFWAIATFRLLQASHRAPTWIRPLLKLAIKPWYLGAQIVTGVELDAQARIGPGLYIGHFGGVVVHGRAVIGSRCNLSHEVTIGEAEGAEGVRGVPVLGERVYVGPGAKVFGPIHVGSDSAIGANAVVNRDVPPGVTVGGVPARIISRHGSAKLIELRRPDPFEAGPDPQRTNVIQREDGPGDLVDT